jgi:hypothetical protein
MKWGAIGLGATALALVVGAFVFALTTRADAPGSPAIVTTITPASATTSTPTIVTTVASPAVKARPPAAAKPAPPAKKPARRVTKRSCQGGDPTGSDTPSCDSSDNQAGDRNSGDGSGDDQAGDSDSGVSGGDNQAGDGNQAARERRAKTAPAQSTAQQIVMKGVVARLRFGRFEPLGGTGKAYAPARELECSRIE